MTRRATEIGLGRVGSLVVTYRRPLLLTLAAAAGGFTVEMPADMADFARVGGQLLSGHLARVYDGSWNQAGPLQLIASRLLLDPSGNGIVARPVIAVVDLCLMLLAVRMCRRLGPATSTQLARRELIVGGITFLWLTGGTFWSGHPAEVAVPIFWIAAVDLQRRGRWITAAAALGLAAAVAPWAVLAYPCLLAAAPVFVAFRTAAVAAVIAVSAYLPFALSGHFAMFRHVWPIDRGSLIHQIDPTMITFDWPLRIGQAVLISAGCGFVAWRCRRRPSAAALGLMMAVALRILTDPVRFDYYWIPFAVAAIAALALVPMAAPRPVHVAVLILAYLPWAAAATGWTIPLAVLCLVIIIVMVSQRASAEGCTRTGNGSVSSSTSLAVATPALRY